MNYELMPIKKLIIVSIVLHIVALCISAIFLIFGQTPLWPLFTSSPFPTDTRLLFPPLVVVAPIALVFILHGWLTSVFIKTLNCGDSHVEQLRMLSVFSMIAIAIVLPIVGIIWGYAEHFLTARSTTGVEDLLALVVMRNLMGFGMVIRGVSISVLLIAAAMLWYYCFRQKAENRETHSYVD